MEDISNVFTDTLRELMEDSHIDVSRLSEIINCDKAAIRRWLYKRYLPDPETVIKIADAFNVSSDYLFGLSDNKKFIKTTSSDNFYQRYAHLRDLNNYSDYIISKDCKIRDSAISKWKNIKRFPTIVSLLKLAVYFDCSLEYLLGRSQI